MNLNNKHCVLVIGPPGAGKGTQGELLARQYRNGRFFSTGMLLRKAAEVEDEVGFQIKAIIASGGMVPAHLTLAALERAIQDAQGASPLFLDFAGDLSQCLLLEKLLARYNYSLEAILLIEVPYTDLIQRLRARNREDDQECLIVQRVAFYEKTMREAINHFTQDGKVCRINGLGTPKEVALRCFSSLLF